jgi:hypothetical protein
MTSKGPRLQRHVLRYLIEAVLLSGLATAVLIPWGCSRSPVSPADIPTQNTFLLPNGLIAYPGTTSSAGPDSLCGPQAVPIYRDTGSTIMEEGTWGDVIGATGGVIEMVVDGEASFFTVPAADLMEKTEISVTIYRRGDAVDKRITEFHFEPEGLAFKDPAMLSYSTILKDGEKLQLYWWDPTAEKWMSAAEAVVVGGYATFPIEHFSDYRTTERISLGGQRGGQ